MVRGRGGSGETFSRDGGHALHRGREAEAVGPWNLTFTAQEAVEAAKALSHATIVPLHYEGWKHFSESRNEIERAFRDAGLARRVTWLERGIPTELAAVA